MINKIARLIKLEGKRQLRKAINETNKRVEQMEIDRLIEKCERIENKQIQWHNEQIQWHNEQIDKWINRTESQTRERAIANHQEQIQWHNEQIDFLSKSN